MNRIFRYGALSLAAAMTLAGCVVAPAHRTREVVAVAPPPPPPPPPPQVAPPARHTGTVVKIQVVDRGEATGAGAILGGVIGGVLGNQIGDGSGRAAATAIGAFGGAVIGNETERANNRADEVHRYTVQMDNGKLRTFQYHHNQRLHINQRVMVVDGNLQVI